MAVTILVCDDRDELRELARDTLAGLGYGVVEARDGREASRLVRSIRPELVLLDVVIPGRSGLEVLEEIRRDPTLADTPVILCTATRRSLGARGAAELGADRYLEKPVRPAALAAAVAELVGERR